jgi:hypothetical protein
MRSITRILFPKSAVLKHFDVKWEAVLLLDNLP